MCGGGGGGAGLRTFQKLSHLGGVQNILLERADNSEKGMGVGTFLLLYSSVVFTVCGEGGE